MNDTYKTIEAPSQAIFKDRGSKFLAYAYPFSNKEGLKEILQNLKKEHLKAVHFCFAYRLGQQGETFRANDDGEPSGSAGKPILGQIDSLGLTEVLVVVVRYFGGTLLGVPGLINAYKNASLLSLEAATQIEKPILKSLTVAFDYPLLGDVMNLIKQFDAVILQQELTLFCKVSAAVLQNQFPIFQQKMSDIYGVKIEEDDNKK